MHPWQLVPQRASVSPVAKSTCHHIAADSAELRRLVDERSGEDYNERVCGKLAPALLPPCYQKRIQ